MKTKWMNSDVVAAVRADIGVRESRTCEKCAAFDWDSDGHDDIPVCKRFEASGLGVFTIAVPAKTYCDQWEAKKAQNA